MKLVGSKKKPLEEKGAKKPKVVKLAEHKKKGKLTPEPVKKAVNIDKLVQEYSDLNAQMNILKSRKDTLATMIKGYACENGTKDDKGSFNCENSGFVFGQVATYSKKVREDAAEKLVKWGFDDCLHSRTVVDVDESLLEKYFSEGALTEENILDLFEYVPSTPRIFVTKKEEMPEVDTGRLSAAKTKGKLIRR